MRNEDRNPVAFLFLRLESNEFDLSYARALVSLVNLLSIYQTPVLD